MEFLFLIDLLVHQIKQLCTKFYLICLFCYFFPFSVAFLSDCEVPEY